MDESSKREWAFSKDAKRLILNCHEYSSSEKSRGSIGKTSEALKVHRHTVLTKIVKAGAPESPKKLGNHREKFNTQNSFSKDLIRRTVYEFCSYKVTPTLESLQEKTSGTGYEFDYSNVAVGTFKAASHLAILRFRCVGRVKPGSYRSATIGDCKTKNVIEFVSRDLPVSHNTCCPANIPDSHLA